MHGQCAGRLQLPAGDGGRSAFERRWHGDQTRRHGFSIFVFGVPPLAGWRLGESGGRNAGAAGFVSPAGDFAHTGDLAGGRFDFDCGGVLKRELLGYVVGAQPKFFTDDQVSPMGQGDCHGFEPLLLLRDRGFTLFATEQAAKAALAETMLHFDKIQSKWHKKQQFRVLPVYAAVCG